MKVKINGTEFTSERYGDISIIPQPANLYTCQGGSAKDNPFEFCNLVKLSHNTYRSATSSEMARARQVAPDWYGA